MEKDRLNITSKDFKKLSKFAENIYNTTVVVDYFVANQPEIEECYNLAPVIKSLDKYDYAARCIKNIDN